MQNSVNLDVLAIYPFLTQEHADLALSHKKPEDLVIALACLHQAQLLTDEHQALVFASAHPDKLAEVFYSLKKGGAFH